MAYVFHNRNENKDKYDELVKEACWIRNMGDLVDFVFDCLCDVGSVFFDVFVCDWIWCIELGVFNV